METLPPEMQLKVLGSLSLKELSVLERVSLAWAKAATNEDLFKHVTRVTALKCDLSTNVAGLGTIDVIDDSRHPNGGFYASVGAERFLFPKGRCVFEGAKRFLFPKLRWTLISMLRHLLLRGAPLRSLELFRTDFLSTETLVSLTALLGELGVGLESLALCGVPAPDADWIPALRGFLEGQPQLEQLILGPLTGNATGAGFVSGPWVEQLAGLGHLRVLCVSVPRLSGLESWLPSVGGRLEHLVIVTETVVDQDDDEIVECPQLGTTVKAHCPQLGRVRDTGPHSLVWTATDFQGAMLADPQLHSLDFNYEKEGFKLLVPDEREAFSYGEDYWSGDDWDDRSASGDERYGVDEDGFDDDYWRRQD